MIADRTDNRADGSAAEEERGDGARERRMRREAISAELRQAYAEVLREPVPDSFRTLFGDMPAQRGKPRR